MFNIFKKKHKHAPSKWKEGFGYIHLYALTDDIGDDGMPWHRRCTECGKIQSINISRNVKDLNDVNEKLVDQYIKNKPEHVYLNWKNI